MKRILITGIFLAVGLVARGAWESTEPAEARTPVMDAAVDSYVYGYPLVMMDQTKRVMTNVKKAGPMHAPVGQFAHMRQYPTPEQKDVTTPNADTLYSSAFLDLSNDAYVLSIPFEWGRYYLMPVLSAWTEVISSPGKRTMGFIPFRYLITGPNFKGKVPFGMRQIKSPTSLAWIVGRTYADGTEKDFTRVHRIQDRYRLTPLSKYGRGYRPEEGKVDPAVDMKTPVRDQVNALTGTEFFSRLALLLKDNPPAEADTIMLAKLKTLGIEIGAAFDPGRADAAVKEAIDKAPAEALRKISTEFGSRVQKKNGWAFDMNVGHYGADYRQRAYVAYFGLGANLPTDAVYPMTSVDKDGQALSGTQSYRIHFDKADLPPVRGFWSLTMYGKDMFFAENPLKKYNVSPRNKLKYNEDGSLDLYIRNESPGADKEANWLPAPKGEFNLVLRLYWPKDAVLDGTWAPPAVEKLAAILP